MVVRLRRSAQALFVLSALSACGGPAEPVWAPDQDVAAARYAHPGPATVTLFTVRSTDTGFGAHAGLMVSGSERVIFDPAGSFKLPSAPERNDVHHGITPRVLAVYIDYHARETYDVEIMEVNVQEAEADELIALMKGHGAVPKAQCSLAITRVLARSARFESVPITYFPSTAADAFGDLPGVTARIVTDDDADDNHGVLIEAAEN